MWLAWIAKMQLVPAILALNFVAIAVIALLTVFFGRIYCSVICPLGTTQDIFSFVAGKIKKNRFKHRKELKFLRYGILIIFTLLLIFSLTTFAGIIDPYSAFGRMMENLVQPIIRLIINGLASIESHYDSYLFWPTEVWIKSLPTFIIAVVTLVVIAVLAVRSGRLYCNTICPVGAILGLISKKAIFKINIDTTKCNGCGLCAKNCKSECIDPKEHKIDYSRCVACMDCIGKCRQNAISFCQNNTTAKPVDTQKRSFLTLTALFATTAIVKAQEKTVDGGLAMIEDKKPAERKTPLVPAGSQSLRHFWAHCTGCQLCVSKCENNVLRPSSDLLHFMQPEMSYERGYCRPECTACADVCPTGAIKLTDRIAKSSIQIGHAVWIRQNCLIVTDGVNCGNCAKHCPSSAIQMVNIDSNDPNSKKIPTVITDRCIGCGACENLCPVRPFSAIYVEGHENHRLI